MIRRKRKLLPKPPEPPAGYMYFYWEPVPIEHVERCAKANMRRFDRRSRPERDAINLELPPRRKKAKRR
jgi:hypothetical protein